MRGIFFPVLLSKFQYSRKTFEFKKKSSHKFVNTLKVNQQKIFLFLIFIPVLSAPFQTYRFCPTLTNPILVINFFWGGSVDMDQLKINWIIVFRENRDLIGNFFWMPLPLKAVTLRVTSSPSATLIPNRGYVLNLVGCDYKKKVFICQRNTLQLQSWKKKLALLSRGAAAYVVFVA